MMQRCLNGIAILQQVLFNSPGRSPTRLTVRLYEDSITWQWENGIQDC